MELRFLLLNIVISVLLAAFMGSKRNIGIWWSLFFSIMFSFLIGLILIILSPRRSKNIPDANPNIVTYIVAALFAIGSFICLWMINNLSSDERKLKSNAPYFEYANAELDKNNSAQWRFGWLGVGLIGISIYLVWSPKNEDKTLPILTKNDV